MSATFPFSSSGPEAAELKRLAPRPSARPAAPHGSNPFNSFSSFSLFNFSILLLLITLISARAGFVYESASEFLTSGDFNGDGITDVLVLDKATGNARVGYLDNSANITWSLPLPTGVPSPDALTVGHFRDTNQDAIAITAVQLNRILLLRLSDPSNAPVPALMTPDGLGPNFLVGLSAPDGVASNFDSIFIGSIDNNTNFGVTLLEEWAFVGDALSYYQDAVAQQASLARGNSLILGADPVTYAAALQRGSNDQFVAYSPSNHFALVLSRAGLASGSDYAFGTFNNELLPRFIFYVSGQSNIVIQSLVPTNGTYIFDAGITINLSEPVQRVYYVSNGSDGAAVIQFGDGVQGLTLPGGSPVIASTYRFGGGAAGNVFTGVIPLANGRFALLDAPAGSASSAHAQVIQFDGTHYTQLTSSALPPVSSGGTRANVWLFQVEPFVNSNPGFIASLNDPDWSSTSFFSGGVVDARTESDGGSASGLGNAVTNNLGAPPAGATFAIPNQYGDAISIFTYAPARPPEPIVLAISPPPGLYGGPITVNITVVAGTAKRYYRLSPQTSYALWNTPFVLTNDATIQYYGTNVLAPSQRSRLYSATYTFGRAGVPPPTPPLDLAPGSTNPAPVFTNGVALSDAGTVFYGRRSSNNLATIWAINLDGTGETFITQGAHPRVSRDGRWLAFLRDGKPFNNQGDLWVRNLASGQETLLFSNTNQLIGYDWDLTETNLVFDYTNLFWRIGLSGSPTQLGIPSAFNQGAPAINPVNGQIAFQSLYPGTSALFLAPPDGSSAQALSLAAQSPRWPAWSPDGEHLVFADGYVSPVTDGGRDLWVLELTPTETNLFQITALADNVNGFPHGAVWSPDGTKLVAAATIYNTNGIWVIPLNADCMCSDGPLLLLPTSPGDALDFAGTVLAAPPVQGVVQPELFIRLDPDSAVVYWSTAYQNFVLEYASDLVAPAWTPIPAPYVLNGYYYEYHEPVANLANHKYFRLHYTAP